MPPQMPWCRGLCILLVAACLSPTCCKVVAGKKNARALEQTWEVAKNRKSHLRASAATGSRGNPDLLWLPPGALTGQLPSGCLAGRGCREARMSGGRHRKVRPGDRPSEDLGVDHEELHDQAHEHAERAHKHAKDLGEGAADYDTDDIGEAGRVDVTGVADKALAKREDAYDEFGEQVQKHGPWNRRHTQKKGGSFVSWFFALLFISIIACVPMILHYADEDGTNSATTWTAFCETLLLYCWLFGGLYLFTNVIWFQSVHFSGELRRLTIEESVYLFAQILTTVGYGDITPALPRGQFFIGCAVLLSIILIANMVSRLSEVFLNRLDRIAHRHGWSPPHPFSTPRDVHGNPLDPMSRDYKTQVGLAWKPVKYSVICFLLFVLVGTTFFANYPGEKKTWYQGVYMSLITLSTVGFGAFTPVTHGGMVFGAFWMLFGVMSLGSVVGSFTAYSQALKQWEYNKSRFQAKDVAG